MDIGYFLKLMTEKNASDMFLTTGAPVYIKIEGRLHPLGNTGLPSGMVKKIAYSLMDEGQVPQFERDLELNIAYALPDAGRFRINVFKQRGEIGMVIRAIRSVIPSIEELQLPQVLKNIIMAPRGLVLIVGSTGSGKSTTLASMIDYRNSTSPRGAMMICLSTCGSCSSSIEGIVLRIARTTMPTSPRCLNTFTRKRLPSGAAMAMFISRSRSNAGTWPSSISE